jgi:molybdopterin-binding protein
MSAEAARDLGLEPGMPATAVVKATTVIVERAERTERTEQGDG